MAQLNIKNRMARSITLRKSEVVLRADFESMGSPSQIGQAFKILDALEEIRAPAISAPIPPSTP